MVGEKRSWAERRKEKTARLVVFVISAFLVVATAGFFYLVYYLFTSIAGEDTTGMVGIVLLYAIVYFFAGLVVYVLIALSGSWFIRTLRDYYTEEYSETTTKSLPKDTEGPQATVNLNESQEEATVRVRHPAGADILEVHVADEVRARIEKPRQDDLVTVDKKPDENLEVKTQDAGYRLPTRD